MGYVDGFSLYEYVGSSPVAALDPTGLKIENVGVNTDEAKGFLEGAGLPVEITSYLFRKQYLDGHSYGGTGTDAGRVKLLPAGALPPPEGNDCDGYTACGTYRPVAKLGSRTSIITLSDASARALASYGVDVDLLRQRIAFFNQWAQVHEMIRAFIWQLPYDDEYHLCAHGDTAQEAADNLREQVNALEEQLHGRQQAIYEDYVAPLLRGFARMMILTMAQQAGWYNANGTWQSG